MTIPGATNDLETRLGNLEHPVRLVLFTQTFGCDTCLLARQVVDQIASLSERVTVEEHNLILDKEKVEEYRVERAPAIAVVGDTDPGIRYYGVPAGYELASLLEAVLLVGSREVGLSDETVSAIAAVDHPVDIKVFVTPT